MSFPARIRAVGVRLASPSALLWAVAAILVVRPQTDPDYWWHLRVGDWILAEHAVPHVDLLSWLANGPWQAHEWGNEVIFAGLQQALGSPIGSVILFGLVNLACLILVAVCARLLRPALSSSALASLVLVAAVAAAPVWSPRGQMWDIFFSLLALRILLGYFERGERRGLWLLAPLTIAWANLHGGGVDFLWAVGGAILVGEWWNRRRRPSHAQRPMRAALFALIVATLAMVLNPYGSAIWLYPLGTVASAAQASLILEWHSPNFHDFILRPAQLLIAVGLIAGLASVRVRDGRALALITGLTFLFLQSVRYAGLWAPLTLAVAGPYLCDAVALVWRTASAPARLAALARRPSVRLAVRLASAALVLSLVVTDLAVLPAAGNRINAVNEPVATADWLAVHPEILASGRLWNDYGWGGYLSWRLGVQVGPYGAADAFDEAALEEFDGLAHLTVDPAPFLDAQAVNVVVYPADRPLAFWLAANPDWQLVHRDDVAVTYVRAP